MAESSSQSYRGLRVWNVSMQLAEDCYKLTRAFPKDELYGMTSQIRRAAASVPANIAEAYGREHRGEYVHLLRVSQGSLKELETHLLLSKRVGLADESSLNLVLNQCETVGKMLRALIRSLQKESTK